MLVRAMSKERLGLVSGSVGNASERQRSDSG